MERNILRLTIIMTLWLYHKPVFGKYNHYSFLYFLQDISLNMSLLY